MNRSETNPDVTRADTRLGSEQDAPGTLAVRHRQAVRALRAVQHMDEDGGFTLADARQAAGRALADLAGDDAAGTAPVRKFSWDHRAQPPVTEIAAAVTEMSGGTIRVATGDTGGDWYELHLEALPGPPVLTFVTWVPETDSVAVKHDGEVVWEENSFDSLPEYFSHCELLGVPVVLRVETPDDEGGVRGSGDAEGGAQERLARKCRSCGYAWAEACADAGSDAGSAASAGRAAQDPA